MVLQIDDLKLPPSLEGSAELINRDTQRQTVSGRLITKLDPIEKWKITISFDSIVLADGYRGLFYSRCALMRREARLITFVSPYDGLEATAWCKCIDRATPEALHLYQRRPWLYRGAGAVFQEV